MVNYSKCGHETRGVIIMNSDVLSHSVYIQWALEEEHLEKKDICFDCFIKGVR